MMKKNLHFIDNSDVWAGVQICSVRHNSKLDMPKLNTTLIYTPIFDWCVVRCGSKTWHHNDICLKRIALRAPKVLTILDSIINMLGGRGPI